MATVCKASARFGNLCKYATLIASRRYSTPMVRETWESGDFYTEEHFQIKESLRKVFARSVVSLVSYVSLTVTLTLSLS